MKKLDFDSVYAMLDEMKQRISDLEAQQNKSEAPERIAMDPTSEDSFGLFVVARDTERLLNHDVYYVREDLAQCDYYESYIAEKMRAEQYRQQLEDIFLACRLEDETDSNLHDVIKNVHQNIYRSDY